MIDCERLRPILYRVPEGEASPEEAMRTAQHLSDCTACRILVARERRLAAMLERDLADPLQVGEDFVLSVMSSLPQGPPPSSVPASREQEKTRRHLRLAAAR